MNLKILTAAFLILFNLQLMAGEKSLDELIRFLKDPERIKESKKLSRYLTVEYPEYGGGPLKKYSADSFKDASILWNSSDEALLFATANPPTEATPCCVAVLIYTVLNDSGWSIKDQKGFYTDGKYSGAKAEYTSSSNGKDLINGRIFSPIIIVTLSQGGRGYEFLESATYQLKDGKITKREINEFKPKN